MTIWVDAHLSPRIARWMSSNFSVTAVPIREIGLREADDDEIFIAARQAGAVVMTKDSDFVRLLEDLGSPPKVLWLTCGNTSDAALQQLLATRLPQAIQLFDSGEELVEIGNP
jgi:predicted nuclease of predicted toxin-antitoxin system